MLRQLKAILALPLTVCALIPAFLVGISPPLLLPLGWRPILAILGAVLVLVGLALLIATARLFAHRGHGTLAPWDPPQQLVVTGLYRYVRNPMILGVMAMVLGEAALCAAPALLGWALFVVLANAVYIPLSEEPGLRRRFGPAYERYCAQVPRWLPRRTPWEGDLAQSEH